jgi:hypothetical protein
VGWGIPPAIGFYAQSTERGARDFFQISHVTGDVPFMGAKGDYGITHKLTGPVIGDSPAPHRTYERDAESFESIERDQEVRGLRETRRFTSHRDGPGMRHEEDGVLDLTGDPHGAEALHKGFRDGNFHQTKVHECTRG